MVEAVDLSRPLHPRHGIHQQDARTPVRIPGSARRTSTIDSLRPDGPRGLVIVHAVARDVVTAQDDSVQVTGQARMHGEVDYLGGYLVRSLAATPSDHRLTALIGKRASSGFRAAVVDCVPDEAETRTPLYLLLDDFPAALLVSGAAVISMGAAERPAGPRLQHADMCAGWRTGGTLMAAAERGQSAVPTGPVSSSLDVADDPLAWHLIPPLPPQSTRRRRRIDVRINGDRLLVDAHFRDSYVTASGIETSIHEYSVDAVADVESLRLLEIQSKAHALPFVECNIAPLSAGDIKGRTLGELRGFVRNNMTGIRTCTHLNDTLRALDDVVALAAQLRETEV